MRIVYLCPDPGIPVLGHKGASVHLRSLASALVRRGHDVLLVARAIEGENAPPDGVVLERLPGGEPDQGVWLATRLHGWRADVVLERYSLASGAGLQAARTLKLAFVLEVNAPLVDEAARYRGLTGVHSWRARERELLRSSDRVIAVSRGVRDHVLASGLPSERAIVVPNGVDTALFAAGRGNAVRRQHGLRGVPVVGFAGSLKPWHGVGTLVRVAAGLPENAHLLVVGEGPQREEVQVLAAALGIGSRLRMVGAVPYPSMPDYLAAMDVAVAPYEPQSGFYFSPLKVVEYMAAGLPVVASNQGDLQEIIGEAGILVPPGDEPALRDALLQLLNDEVLRTDLGMRGRRRAGAMTWDAAAARIEAALAVRPVAA